MAQVPYKCREDLNFEQLIGSYELNIRPKINEGMEIRNDRYNEIDTNFQEFAENRNSGFISQFSEIFVRNSKFLFRNKKAFSSIISNAIFIALVMLSVFYHVAVFPPSVQEKINSGDAHTEDDMTKYFQYRRNLGGVTLHFSNQMSVSATLNVILQVPMQVPVTRRELGSKMYSPSTAFLGRFFSNMIIQVMYPGCVTLILFWALGINTSLENLAMTFVYAIATTCVFVGQGFTIGTIFENEDTAKQMNQMIIMLMFATSGIMNSATGSNAISNAITAVSPSRLSCEGVFRRFTENVPVISDEKDNFYTSPELMHEFYGYTYGDELCLLGLGIWWMFWVIVGLIVTNLRYRTP